MFRYQDTGKQSQPKEKQVKQVVATRKVTYINPHPNPKVKEPVITEGFEIVKEITVSPENVGRLVSPESVGSKTVEFKPPQKKIKKQDYNREESNGQD